MSDPITAIIPLRNYHEPFLRASLASLLEQSSPDWCAIIVVELEDRELFSNLLANELRDQRLRLEVNGGRKLAGAINTAMRLATSEFVALLLSDDLWSSDAVEVLQRYRREHPQADFFHTARRIIDGQGHSLSSVHASRESFTISDFVNSAPVKHLLCWRRELGLTIGGLDETLNSVGPDDYDFPWMMAEHGAQFVAIPDCLYIYRDHREGFRLTTHLSLRRHQREIDRILRKHGIPWWSRRKRIADATRGYLQQCLYRSRFDRWLKNLRGFDPREGTRARYR